MGNCRWTGPLRRTRRFIWFNFSKMITKNAKTATMKKEHKQKHVFSILSTQLVNEFCWRLFWQLQKSTNARIISQYKKAQSGRSNSRALKNKRPHQHSDNFHERLSTNSILHSQLVQDPALNFLQHHQIPNSGQSLPQNLLNSLKFQKNKKKKIKKDKKKMEKIGLFFTFHPLSRLFAASWLLRILPSSGPSPRACTPTDASPTTWFPTRRLLFFFFRFLLAIWAQISQIGNLAPPARTRTRRQPWQACQRRLYVTWATREGVSWWIWCCRMNLGRWGRFWRLRLIFGALRWGE